MGLNSSSNPEADFLGLVVTLEIRKHQGKRRCRVRIKIKWRVIWELAL